MTARGFAENHYHISLPSLVPDKAPANLFVAGIEQTRLAKQGVCARLSACPAEICPASQREAREGSRHRAPATGRGAVPGLFSAFGHHVSAPSHVLSPRCGRHQNACGKVLGCTSQPGQALAHLRAHGDPRDMGLPWAPRLLPPVPAPTSPPFVQDALSGEQR